MVVTIVYYLCRLISAFKPLGLATKGIYLKTEYLAGRILNVKVNILDVCVLDDGCGSDEVILRGASASRVRRHFRFLQADPSAVPVDVDSEAERQAVAVQGQVQ